MMYPGDIHFVGRTKQEYFKKIDEALKSGWSLENARRAYRWCVYEFFHATLDLSDGYHYSETATGKGIIEKALSKMGRIAFKDFQERLDLFRKPRVIRAADLVRRLFDSGADSIPGMKGWVPPVRATQDEETRGLIIELKRLHEVLFAGEASYPVRKGTLREKIASVF
jgi:hypothetical protein